MVGRVVEFLLGLWRSMVGKYKVPGWVYEMAWGGCGKKMEMAMSDSFTLRIQASKLASTRILNLPALFIRSLWDPECRGRRQRIVSNAGVSLFLQRVSCTLKSSYAAVAPTSPCPFETRVSNWFRI